MSDEQKPEVPAQRREERLLAKPGFTFLPQSWEQLYSYAKEICQTDFTPKTFRGNAGMVLAAWQKGAEVGLQPMASLESIAVINGVTSIHSDGFWALVVSSPLCESFEELQPADCLKLGYGECTIKRRGNPKPITRRFTMEMAKTAELLGKDNWKHYPGRMLQQRARHLAADDAVPEATQGLVPSDVARDYDEPRDVTPIKQPQAIMEKKEDERQTINDPPRDRATKKTVKESKPVESKATEPEAAPPEPSAEQSQEDLINQLILWCESAPDTDMQDKTKEDWLFAELKKVKGTVNQMKVLKPFNDRRQAIAKN